MSKRKLLNDFINEVSKEDLYNYWLNNSKENTAKHFNMSISTMDKLIKLYNIKKPVENIVSLRESTNKKRYNKSYYTQTSEYQDKVKKTNLDKYGCEWNIVSDNFKEKSKNTIVNKYGSIAGFYKNNMVKIRKTVKDKYGVDCIFDLKDKINNARIEKYGSIKNCYSYAIKKQSEAIKKKYGVNYACQLPQAKAALCSIGCDSLPNINFEKLLIANNIEFTREFPIDRYSYDFKVNNTLIEINPTATHNSTYGIFNNPKDKNYHMNKSALARANGYNCICVWDWDSVDKVINHLSDRDKIYARKCTISIVEKEDAEDFINTYHYQNYAKDSIRLGLYYNNILVSIMTFGKPRYNKKYEYELIRYCSSKNIIGGAEKLFKYFLNSYNPKSVISYCDLAKFNGDVYNKLGFKEINKKLVPSAHWYDGHRHITDNLLRQRGFDQLFNTDYGKNTSNEELMINNNFVKIYDCGQSTYSYIAN